MARAIVSEFINYSGKSVVNIDSSHRKRIEDIMASGVPVPPNVFDSAVHNVHQLIKIDSYPKFLARVKVRARETDVLFLVGSTVLVCCFLLFFFLAGGAGGRARQ